MPGKIRERPSGHAELVRNAWDQHAHEYQDKFSNKFKMFYYQEANRRVQFAADHLLARQLELGQPLRALDIGCGGGDVFYRYLTRGGEFSYALGVDLSEKMVRVARAKFTDQGGVQFRVQDILELPDDETFDVLVAVGVVEYVEDHRKFLDKCFRLLSPSGTLVLSFNLEGSFFRQLDKAYGRFRRWALPFRVEHLNRYYSQGGFLEEVRTASFNILKIEYLGYYCGWVRNRIVAPFWLPFEVMLSKALPYSLRRFVSLSSLLLLQKGC